jgi:hypothetical protein
MSSHIVSCAIQSLNLEQSDIPKPRNTILACKEGNGDQVITLSKTAKAA